MVYDFSRFAWKPLARNSELGQGDSDGALIREAAAGELMEYLWKGLGLGDYVFIFMAELAFTVDIPQDTLLQCMQHAWAEVRYDIPTVSAHTVYDAERRTHIIYRPARHADDAADWAKRTVRRVTGYASIEEFRHTLWSKAIRDDNGDQTFLYVLPHGSTARDGCSVLVHTSHITFDAKGSHGLFTAFMKKLAVAISVYPTAPYQGLAWGTEGKNILPSPYGILVDEEKLEGPEYDATNQSILQDSIVAFQHGHGLKPRFVDNYALETKRTSFTFTEKESLRFLAKVKSLEFTVNHVCHAALAIASAEENPVPEEKLDTAVFGYGQIIDGRPRLRPPFSERGGYPGFCLATSHILIPAKTVYDSRFKDDVSRLLHISALMKKEYEKPKTYASLVAVQPERTAMLVGPFINNPNPPPLTSTVPWYSADGRGESYLDQVYRDQDGKVVAEILSFVNSVNKLDPAPFFRVWSWRDRLTMTVDYNPHAVPDDVIEGLLKRWKELVGHLMQ